MQAASHDGYHRFNEDGNTVEWESLVISVQPASFADDAPCPICLEPDQRRQGLPDRLQARLPQGLPGCLAAACQGCRLPPLPRQPGRSVVKFARSCMLSPSYVQILCSAGVDAHPGLQALQMHGLIYTRPCLPVRILSGKGILLRPAVKTRRLAHVLAQLLGSNKQVTKTSCTSSCGLGFSRCSEGCDVKVSA